MVKNIGSILGSDTLVSLVQTENFIGWAYAIDYDRALIMTNDYWKASAMGIPHNCFLVATAFNPEQYQRADDSDKEVILLRVIGTCKLPQDDDLVKTKIDYFQQRKDIFDDVSSRGFDDITQNQLQFGGLECRVLGTFYTSSKDGELRLGSDLESFEAASRLRVYRPRNKALETIVNYIDPDRRKAAKTQAKDLGINKPLEPFPIGKVRYTSTDRLHRKEEKDLVQVSIQPADFLARRTAVLGMTRTGKSNMIKQLVSVVKRVSDEGDIPIGQIIYDLNGEYGNPNKQDKGSLYDIYGEEEVKRYRMLKTDGFEELQNNFYLQLGEGHRIIRQILIEKKFDTQIDAENFLNCSLDFPGTEDFGELTRWKVRSSAYKALLYQAGFEPPENHIMKFKVAAKILTAVRDQLDSESPLKEKDPNDGLTLREAIDWFLAARKANKPHPIKSSGNGDNWLDKDTVAILNLLAQKNDNDTAIRGFRILSEAIKYHSPRRTKDVGDEVYKYLLDGKIVILDLSVGDSSLRERISKQIAADIFYKSMNTFVADKVPPNIVVYIEEAHNLIGKKNDLTDIWPKVAKEGAKYRISLVYATQEVSSMHENILANTENWFITHLNNEKEIKELSKFYDFGDFARSLLRAQDVGFARVKTLSSPFVIPVQIDKFDPEAERTRALLQGL